MCYPAAWWSPPRWCRRPRSRSSRPCTGQTASLQVSVDGSRAALVRPDSAPNTWLVTSPSGTAPHSMEVSYRLDGAIVRREPSVDGRALALLTPIAYGAVTNLPITIDLAAAWVLNVYCPPRPRQPRSCAASSTGTTGR